MTRLIRLATLGMPLLLLGCASTNTDSYSPAPIDREGLLSGPVELAAPEPAVDILALDDEMRAFLAREIPDNAHQLKKIRMLVEALFTGEGMQIRYDSFETNTAIETFHSREGNCLSFANLFVAMAREVGLPAYFQEVKTPTTWDERGRLYISSRHINVLLKYRHADDQVVDFDIANFDQEYPHRQISDEAAMAQYHNNMAIHWLLEEDARKALAHQRLALELTPREYYMWTNLGVIYANFGYPDYAEAAYLTALSYNDDDMLATSNLASLYEAHGKAKLAASYRQRAEASMRRNPFYLYARAEQFYADGRYRQARKELERAIRTRRGDHRFHHLLALTELSLGEPERAQRNFQLARTFAQEPEDQARYNRKLDLLVGAGSKQSER
jgi:Flp pilus assembly protein TadD